MRRRRMKRAQQEGRLRHLILMLLIMWGLTWAFESSSNNNSKIRHRRRLFSLSSSSSSSSYGRGSDIWPPTNENSRIRLSDSFPNGIIPDVARRELQQIGAKLPEDEAPLVERKQHKDTLSISTTGAVKAQDHQQHQQQYGRKRRALARILRRAARRQEDVGMSSSSSSSSSSVLGVVDKTPLIVAVMLLFSGTIQPLDCLFVTFLSMYTWLLTIVASSVRNSNTDDSSLMAPVLPALPPTGHVPFLVRHPLGWKLTHSRMYDAWLSAGVAIGLVAPFLFWLQQVLSTSSASGTGSSIAATAAAATVALTSRPLFLLSCQAITEATCRRAITPLPIRIFVPLAYNTLRLGYLGWAATTTLSTTTAAVATKTTNVAVMFSSLQVARILAWTNLLYWGVNLFAFLIPVAFMRYMRAHFFAVEAASVSIRPGMQDTVQ